jgi:hypothetical protein
MLRPDSAAIALVCWVPVITSASEGAFSLTYAAAAMLSSP